MSESSHASDTCGYPSTHDCTRDVPRAAECKKYGDDSGDEGGRRDRRDGVERSGVERSGVDKSGVNSGVPKDSSATQKLMPNSKALELTREIALACTREEKVWSARVAQSAKEGGSNLGSSNDSRNCAFESSAVRPYEATGDRENEQSVANTGPTTTIRPTPEAH